MIQLGKIDVRALQRYTSAQAVKDFDRFLDALPVTVGYHALIAAGMAWAIASAAVLFAFTEVGKVSKFRADLMEVSALKPPIPVLKYDPVSKAELDKVGRRIKKVFGDIDSVPADGRVSMRGTDTDYFPQFLGAINFLQNAQKNWRVTTESMCVGRDCKGSPVSASFKVEYVRIGDPETADDKSAKEGEISKEKK